MQKILVAIDGSEKSKKALDFACDLAEKFGSAMHLLHVPQGPVADQVMVLGGAAITIHADRDALERAGRAVVAAAEDRARARGLKDVATEIRGGDPAHEIVECAAGNDVDVIVIGSRGLGNFGSLLLGSVSHKVNHTAPCTCITVH